MKVMFVVDLAWHTNIMYVGDNTFSIAKVGHLVS
jgi:hypothetical protein